MEGGGKSAGLCTHRVLPSVTKIRYDVRGTKQEADLNRDVAESRPARVVHIIESARNVQKM